MLRDLDNFDFYTAPADRWTMVVTPTIVAGQGRNGTSALYVNGNGWGVYRVYDNQSTWICHFAVKFGAIHASSASSFFRLNDVATVQVALHIVNGGYLQILRGTTVLATGTTQLGVGVYYHIQVKATIHLTAGSVEVRLNNETEISVSGVNTRQSANAYADRVGFIGGGAWTAPFYIDDYVALDTQGTVNNDFLGDRRVYLKLADGAGNYAEWTPSAGANWQNIDDAAQDGDTTYNSSGTPGQKDSFAFAGAGLTGTVNGLMMLWRVRKDDAGTRNIRRLIRIAGADYVGASLPNMPDAYVYQQEILEQNPATSPESAWTTAVVDAAEYGYDLES